MNKSSKDFRLGITFAIINSFSLGILGVIDKIGISQSGINPFIFSTQSVLFGLVFITIFSFIYSRGQFVNELKNTSNPSWKLIFLVGIFASGLFVLFRFLGLTQSTGTFATLSQIVTTAITAILAYIFLKERLSGKFWLLFTTIIVAIYFVSVGRFTVTNIQVGDTYILLGTLFLAAANIFSKLAIKQVSPIILSFGRFLVGGLFLLLVSLLFFNGTTDLGKFTIWSILSGLFWTVNNTTFNFAIQRIGITLATSILMLAPVITMTFEYLILKHSFNPIQIIAAFVVIISGILITTIKK